MVKGNLIQSMAEVGLSDFSPPPVCEINTHAWSQIWNNDEIKLEYLLGELNHSKYF